jgi:hypothetical protein
VSNLSRFLVLPAVLLTPCLYAGAQPADTNRATLFQNVRVFDGKSGTVGAASNVLVEGNVIPCVPQCVATPCVDWDALPRSRFFASYLEIENRNVRDAVLPDMSAIDSVTL